MVDKIDSLTLPNSGGTTTTYDIDLPKDATPSVASLTATGNIEGGAIKKTGGTSSEFLNADGSVSTLKTINNESIVGSGNITINGDNYYPTAVSWTNGGANGPTGTITMSGTSNVSIPAIPSASTSYSGVVTTGGQTFAGNKGFTGSVVLNNGGTFYKPVYLGAGIPSKGDGSTVYFGEDLIMNRRTGAISGFYAESSQWNRFLGLHMNPAYICTCNYKGNGSATTATSADGLWKASQTGDNTQWSGNLGYLFNSNFTNGATFPVDNLSTNPIVITVKSATGTRIDASDTDYVELNGWRYEGYQGTSNYYGKLTAYKLEILTDYENDTWVKVFERTNVEDNIYSIKFPVWSSVGGSASYTNFYGIRLTISGAVAGSSGYLGLTELKLMETRPAGAPSDGVGAISQLGGNLYGNITLPSKSGAGKYTEIKISPSDSDNYNQLGESSKQWYRIYGKNIYRNGTEINNLYVPQTRTINNKALSSDITLSASDVSALPSSTSYIASASVSGNTLTITPSSGSAITFSPTFSDTDTLQSVTDRGATTTNSITLSGAAGSDSPRLNFVRGTLDDTYNDWSIYDTGGYLHFQQRGSGSTAYYDILTLTQSGGSLVGSLTLGTSGTIASGDTSAVTGGAVYTALTNVAYKNVNNNFSASQTMPGLSVKSGDNVYLEITPPSSSNSTPAALYVHTSASTVYNLQLQNKSGTIALTSDIEAIALPQVKRYI